MYARVTRFTDCDPEAVERSVARLNETEEPPPGVDTTEFKVVVDEEGGTMVFIGLFEDEEKLRAADAALREFDPPGGVPGTRSSVDLGEVKVERSR